MDEKIIFADKNDSPIGTGTREEAWAKGYYVRIVRAIIRDENGRILVQRRSSTKKTYPNCWNDTATGHVDEGESYDSAVPRELIEEIGIETELTFLGKFSTVDQVGSKIVSEFNSVYEGKVESSIEYKLEEGEVSEAKWFDISDLKKMINFTPEKFTPGFKETIRLFY
jgi:isopentenyl-diphosphate delta-isomerase